ncbi:MAG: tetratricopeptide repeat protein, partial [Blastochloris sp.]|nr:tetratricopeptide repeat protein [Blastochloris sp.]
EGKYAKLAGEFALRNGAHDSAADLLRRALELREAYDSSPKNEARLRQLLGAALAESGHYVEAEAQFTHSLEINQQASSGWGEAESLNLLGLLAAQRDQAEAAAKYLLRAMEVADNTQGAQQVKLASLMAMATLLAKAGSKVVALEYATIVMEYITFDPITHDAAQKLIEQIRQELPEDTVRAAIERGRQTRLRDVVRMIREQD